MEHEPLESSLLYHGTYLLDQLHNEQQVSIGSEITAWFRSHLPHTVAPKSVHLELLIIYIWLHFCEKNYCVI